MKKRFAALVCALMMLISLSPPAAAAESVYFTAVDERVLDLTDASMPFWFGGYLYVAATVFRESGVGYSYNIVNQTLVLYESSKSLVYNVSTGSGTNGQGEPYDHVCVTRNGVTFVAASPVASYFGRTYSNTRVNHGYLIRVKTSGALSDAMFTDVATFQLDSKYQQYQRSLSPQTGEETAPAGETAPAEEPAAGKSVYLCFLAEDPATVDGWLDALNAHGGRAAFYFTEEALSRSGSQLRRLIAEGSAVGLVLQSEDPPLEQLRRMNQALFAAAGVKTRLVCTDLTDDIAALQLAGYCPLSADIDRAQYGLTTTGGASTLFKQIGSRRSAASVWLGRSEER